MKLPLALIIFLVILLVIFGIFLLWNSIGFGQLENTTSFAQCDLVQNISRGSVLAGCS